MLVPIFLLIIGGFSVYAGKKTLKHHKRISLWPQLRDAKLISKTIEKRKLVSGSRTAKFIVAIEYEYSVEGKIYRGNHYYAIELIGSERAMSYSYAEKELEKLKNPLSVFYNPENPSESFVIKDHPWFMYFMLIAGILMLFSSLIGFFMLIPLD